MAQAVIPQPLRAEDWVRYRASPRGVCGPRTDMGAGFSPSNLVSPCQHHSIMHHRHHIIFSNLQSSYTTRILKTTASVAYATYQHHFENCLHPFPLAEDNKTSLPMAIYPKRLLFPITSGQYKMVSGKRLSAIVTRMVAGRMVSIA